MNQAPNIVIPGRFTNQQMTSQPTGATSWERYDNEMDLQVRDPRVAAELAEYEKRVCTKLDNQNLEVLAKEHEFNISNSKGQTWHGQERWQGRENEEMRLVNIMHPYTFIRKLRDAGIKAEERDPYLEYMRAGCPRSALRNVSVDHPRIWLNSFTRAGLIGVTAWAWNRTARMYEIATITTLQYPYGPEWSIMRFNEWNVPTKEKYRGWRTALLNLIIKEVLTEDEAHRAFGESRGLASHWYRQQLYDHRAIRLGVRAA